MFQKNFLFFKFLFFLSFWDSIQNQRSVPLYGNSDIGYYYVKIFVGNPPVMQSLILDTGSKMTIFPCKGCANCNKNHMNEMYDPEKSNTFTKVIPNKDYLNWKCSGSYGDSCNFYQSYTEGSLYSGYYVFDDFKFENELEDNSLNYKHIFGCANEETGEFYEQVADGILGIGVTN